MYKTDVCSNLSSDVVRYCRLEWSGVEWRGDGKGCESKSD
jgi:hypothetical protein